MKSHSRRRLRKGVSNRSEYEGTFHFTDQKGYSIVKDVTKKGKVVTDHIWLANTEELKNLEFGTKIRFNATSHTYYNKYKEKKVGLKNAGAFKIVTAEILKCEDNKRGKIDRLHKKSKR